MHIYKTKTPYSCLKCGHNKCHKGRTRYHRKYAHCDYDESATAHTLFHKCKIPLVKAFWMVYWVSNLTKGMSTCELKRQLGLTQKTTWFWKRKIQEGIKPTQEYLLDHLVHVDEMMLGGPEPMKPGRSKGKKKLIAVAVETRTTKKSKKLQIHRAKRSVIFQQKA